VRFKPGFCARSAPTASPNPKMLCRKINFMFLSLYICQERSKIASAR
jgi:hypothetical protein